MSENKMMVHEEVMMMRMMVAKMRMTLLLTDDN